MALKISVQANAPSPESLQLVRNSISIVSPEQASLAQWHKKYGSNHAVRLAHDLDILKRLVDRSKTVLEIGSVPLILTQAIALSGYTLVGCDIAPERYAETLTRNSLNVVKCDIEHSRLPFEDNQFDAIVFNEIFEHLRINLVFTLTEVLRVLKPGGTLMLSSPNLRSLQGLINFLRHNRAFSCSADPFVEFKKLDTLGHMGHVREYTSTEICAFLADIGFSVTELIYRGRYASPIRNSITKVFPRLLPFISYIATKR